MLHLFRSIRQGLINEGKTSKYLRYAVGEILLVMVGILLALQVNNWNEGMKLDQVRLELIENLKLNFQANLSRLDEGLEVADERLRDSLHLMSISAGESGDQLSLDDLRYLAVSLFGSIPFQPALGAYQAAVSTGSIALIDDPVFTELIAQFDDYYRRFLSIDDYGRQDYFLGSMFELRKQLGAMEAMYHNSKELPGTYALLPEIYDLDESDYRKFISEKEVYAILGNRHELRLRHKSILANLRIVTEEILTVLEAL